MVRQNTLPSAPSGSESDLALADALRGLLQAQGILCSEAELRSAARTWERLAPVSRGTTP